MRAARLCFKNVCLQLFVSIISFYCIYPLQTYVRDIYPFRRSVSPQLNLVHMLPERGQELIQKQVWMEELKCSSSPLKRLTWRNTGRNSLCVRPQVFSRKLEEVGRVLFLISLTQHMPAVHKQSHVSLLQEDLLRLPSFPRTAIDAEFSLFNDPQGETHSACAFTCCNKNHSWMSSKIYL